MRVQDAMAQRVPGGGPSARTLRETAPRNSPRRPRGGQPEEPGGRRMPPGAGNRRPPADHRGRLPAIGPGAVRVRTAAILRNRRPGRRHDVTASGTNSTSTEQLE
ncbi:hypothetical protein EAO76_32215 [Streptomyces sp. sk2.1]|nr:hypothetical protein EAO76_32215 [Streptomyces sp. sk2.1]